MQQVEKSKQDPNLKNRLYKVEMLILKILPMILAFLALISTVFDYIDINSTIVNYIMIFVFYIFLYVSSYVFKFCGYHRMFLHYIVTLNILSIIDVYIGIPLSTFAMFQLYIGISGIFLFIILYLYVKNSKKSTT